MAGVEILEAIKTEWNFIRSTPWSQAALIAVYTTCFYFVFKSIYAIKTSNYESRIAHGESRIALYKDIIDNLETKSEGVEMPDVEQNITDLKLKLKELEDKNSIDIAGDNANGRFVRHTDGSQVVYGSIEIKPDTYSNTHAVVYPASFLDVPIVDITPNGKLLVQTKSKTSFTVSEQSPAKSTLSATYIALGRWK